MSRALIIFSLSILSSCSISEKEKKIVGEKTIGGSHYECSIILKGNHSFKFEEIERTNFCWRKGKGSWEIKNEKVILTTSYVEDNCSYPKVETDTVFKLLSTSISKFEKCDCREVLQEFKLSK